jgi:hypothetical protein
MYRDKQELSTEEMERSNAQPLPDIAIDFRQFWAASKNWQPGNGRIRLTIRAIRTILEVT